MLYVAQALFDFEADADSDEISFKKDDIIQVIDQHEDDDADWPEGINMSTSTIGRFPRDYVKQVTEKVNPDTHTKKKFVNLGADAKPLPKPFVVQATDIYVREQADEHSIKMGDYLLVTHESKTDENWNYGQINGVGETRIAPSKKAFAQPDPGKLKNPLYFEITEEYKPEEFDDELTLLVGDIIEVSITIIPLA